MQLNGEYCVQWASLFKGGEGIYIQRKVITWEKERTFVKDMTGSRGTFLVPTQPRNANVLLRSTYKTIKILTLVLNLLKHEPLTNRAPFIKLENLNSCINPIETWASHKSCTKITWIFFYLGFICGPYHLPRWASIWGYPQNLANV